MPETPSCFSENKERAILRLLCVLAAIHVFVFSAALPFFNSVDEDAHFDLVVKYSEGNIPMDTPTAESLRFLATYHSYAFLSQPQDFPAGTFPPPLWKQPAEVQPKLLAAKQAIRGAGINYESSQPPLYYTIAGQWWRLCKYAGLADIHRLYALRFLNVLFVITIVWTGYAAARTIFPANPFVRLGVPLLLAVLPQTTFYSVNNDVLSPVTFGLAFLFLTKWLQAGVPGARLGAAAGIALATTFLAKMSNLPLLAVAAAAVAWKIFRLAKENKWRASLPAIAILFFAAAVPAIAWMATCEARFGDLTGSKFKADHFRWTYKAFGDWWGHPIFTPAGFWYFLSGNISSFWQGEFWWWNAPMTRPLLNLLYTALTLLLIASAVTGIARRSTRPMPGQLQPLVLAVACIIGALAFYGFLSILYDFHECAYPSRHHPYFVSGRLLLGALVPFMLLFVYGLDRWLQRFSLTTRLITLAGMAVFMLVSELVTDWPVFSNEYNWFHR
jgi:Predicted membrane protein (DUF2142)